VVYEQDWGLEVLLLDLVSLDLTVVHVPEHDDDRYVLRRPDGTEILGNEFSAELDRLLA
jgi:hypothetical protein